MKVTFKKLTFAILIFSILSCGDSENINSTEEEVNSTTPPNLADLPNLADGIIQVQDTNFDERLYAIGQLTGDSTCTVVYVRTSHLPDAPAYAFTNGHCVTSVFDDNAVFVDQPYDASITFKVFDGVAAEQQVNFRTKTIAYHTMKGRDIAVVELDATTADLSAQGIEPLEIANAIPESGKEIRTYGIPLFFETEVVRQSTCTQGEKTDIAEFIWLWFDAYSNNCQDIYPGSSGSPVIADLSQGVWGLVNTTTIDALTACELGGPCEWSDTEAAALKENTTYVMDVTDLRNYFNADGLFDIDLAARVLELPEESDASIEGARNFTPEFAANNQLTIKMHQSGLHQYLLTSIEEFDAESIEGFTPFSNDEISIDLPVAEGLYVVSIVYGDSFEHRDFLTFMIDGTKPDSADIELSTIATPEGVFFEPLYRYPELVNYRYKFDSNGQMDCNDTSDYNFYFRIPLFADRDDYEFPIKVCVIGSDLAGNSSIPAEFVIE